MTARFICHLNLAIRCLDLWSDIILRVSVRVCFEKTSILCVDQVKQIVLTPLGELYSVI